MNHATIRLASVASALLLADLLAFATSGVLAAAATVGPANWDQMAASFSRNAVYNPGGHGFSWVDKGVGTVLNSVVVVGNTGYFATMQGNVVAVDARTGAQRWSVHLPNAVFGPPIVHNGVLYVGTGNDSMALESATRWIRGTGQSGWYALDAATGKILWYHKTVGNAKKGITFSNGVLYTIGGGGHLRAMNPVTGKTIWKVYAGGVNSNAEPLVVNNLVITPAGGPSLTSLWAFDRQTGKLIWRLRGDNSDNTPTYGNGLIYVTNVLPYTINGQHMARNVYIAVNASTGRPVWSYAAPLGPFPAAYAAPTSTLHNGVLYCVSPMAAYLLALNAHTGRRLWQTKLQGPSVSSPAVAAGHVFITNRSGYLDMLDASTGAIVSARKVGGAFAADPVTIMDGTLFLAPFTGNVLALADPGSAKVTAANTGNVMAIPVSQVIASTGS